MRPQPSFKDSLIKVKVPMYKSKHYIIVFITSLFIVLSYEIKDLLPVIPFIGKIKFVTPILSAILGFVFGSITIDIFKNILFKFKWIRKIVIGTLWLEGYWFCSNSSPPPKPPSSRGRNTRRQ